MRRSALCIFFLLFAAPALAQFTVCNESGNEVSVAIGYNGAEDWTSEGWWNLGPGDCATPIKGELQARYFYLRVVSDAVDYEMEDYSFCTATGAFTIVGSERCIARGYNKAKFVEVDVGLAPGYLFPIYDDQLGEPQPVKQGDALGSAGEIFDAFQGFWVDIDDATVQTLVEGPRLYDYFEGNRGIGADWSVSDTCDGANGAGPVLLVTYDDYQEETLCWVLLSLTDDNLHFRAVGAVRDAHFRKVR